MCTSNSEEHRQLFVILYLFKYLDAQAWTNCLDPTQIAQSKGDGPVQAI